VRNTFGITISKDGGNSWYWLCEDTLGLPSTSNEDPFLGLTSNNSLVAGLSLGLQVSSDVGCNWTTEMGPLAGQLIKDLVVHKDNPHVVDTVTNTYGAMASDGGPGYAHQLFETMNDGANWAAFGTPIDPGADVTTIEVAPSDPNRIYVSGFRGQGSTRTASLFVSKDHGSTWMDHPTPLNPMVETAVYIGGVDPSNADIVYLRTEGQSRLIVSMDGGQTFMSSKQLTGQMLGFALSQDGSKIYIGSVEDGLWVGDKATLTFVNTNPRVHIQCLATQGSDLWACSDEPSCFVAGISHDDGKTFTARMHLLSIQAPVQCAPDAGAAMCSGNPFVGLCSNVGACYGLDASPLLPLQSTCGCSGSCDPTNPMYNPAAHCPIVGNDASLYCPLTAGDAGEDGGSGSSSSGGAGSSNGSGSSGGSGSGGGSGGSGSSKGCGCGVVGGGGALGFLAAGALMGIAAKRRRRTGGRA
jgi:MYXO-CTERM domain-containing protein